MPQGPNNPSNKNPGAIYQQVQQDAGFYPPLVYDLLTRFSSLTTTNDWDAGAFLPLTDVQPGATFNTLPFCIGFIPPSSPVTNRLISRQSSVHDNMQGPQFVSGNHSQGLNPGNNGPSPTSLSQAGAQFIAYHEGFGSTYPPAQYPGQPNSQIIPEGGSPSRGNAYYDNAGLATIGYGHLLPPMGSPLPNGLTPPITQEQAISLLQSDSAYAANAVSQQVTQPLTQNQYDALVSFTFSAGPGGLAKSGLPALINAGNYQGAADAWSSTFVRNAAGNVDPGLAVIRPNEAALFSTPDGQTYAFNPSILRGGSTPVTGDVGGLNGWNQSGGSGNAQQAANQIDSTANSSLTPAALTQAFMARQQAEITDLQNRMQQMAQTPPLRLLVNPRSFKNSLEKITADGNWGRNGPIIEHWGEQQDKIEGAGKIAAFFTVDTQAMPDGSVGNDPGLSRMTRNWSTSYQNLLSLYLIYRNNGGIWTKDYTSQGTVQGDIFTYRTNLATLGSIYIYYDGIMYVGSFDNFSISEAEDTPFSLEYNFSFTVRAWFLLDTQQNPLTTYQARIAVNGPLTGVQPLPGQIPSNATQPFALGNSGNPAAGAPVPPPPPPTGAAALLTDIGLL